MTRDHRPWSAPAHHRRSSAATLLGSSHARTPGPWPLAPLRLGDDAGHMSTEDRIKKLEAQIDKLQAKQAELNKQLAQAEIDQWQGRIEDLELQMHLAAMETNDKLRGLLDQAQHKWADAKVQLESTTSVATESFDSLRASLQTAFKDIRQALVDAKDKISS